MELSKKAAYVKELAEQLNIDNSTAQGKVIKAMTELLEEMAGAIEEMAVLTGETIDVVDSISDELSELEDALFDEGSDGGDEDGSDEVLYECICPTCGENIVLDDAMIETGAVECPNCGESLEFDFSEEDETEE